jgi:branched-chain amino acid transport system substrate-binding protein
MRNGIVRSVLALGALVSAAAVQAQDLKVGVIYDLTGPLAGGGSKAGQLGTKIAIDMINERGGVEGRKIVPFYADAQSKTDVAINETERLLNDTKVDVLMGFFSSAQCVPISAKIDAAKKFLWLNICVSSAVMKDKGLQYVFRAQVHSDQYGEASCKFLAENAKAKFGREAKDLKVAIIHEDGPYGSGIASVNESSCKALGMPIVHKEGYAATSGDLSALVTKLRRARPDVILHTGYNPDITLFLRQAKEAGLKWGALIGHGAGYAQIDKLYETFKGDVDYLYNVDPVAAQLLDGKSLKAGIGDLTAEMVRRYKAEAGASEVPTHVSSGFNQAWVFFSDVLPRAIKTHGGTDPEALRKAALETDIAPGGTIQGYGVKFFGPGTPLAGQSERSEPAIMQYVKGETKVVSPAAIRTADPVLPLPKGHAYAN